MSFGRRGLEARVANIVSPQTQKSAPEAKEEEPGLVEALFGLVVLGGVAFGVYSSAMDSTIVEWFRGKHDITKRIQRLDINYVGPHAFLSGTTTFHGYHETPNYDITGVTLEVSGNEITRSFDCYSSYPIGPHQKGDFECNLYLDGLGSTFNYRVTKITGVRS